MWHRQSPYFYYANGGYLVPFVTPIHIPKPTQHVESPRISPGIAFLQQPQRFEFDEKEKDFTNLSESEFDSSEILQTLYSEARSLPRFNGKERQSQVKIKAPEVPTVENKQIKNEEILKVIDEYNAFKLHKQKQKLYENLISDPTLAAMLYSIPTPSIDESFFPPNCKNITEMLNGKNRIFINNQQYNGRLSSSRDLYTKTGTYNKGYCENDIFTKDKDLNCQDDYTRSSRLEGPEKPFWNTMDRPGSPVRKMITTRFQMPRKNIQTNFFEAEYLNAVSPSFIYFREIHHPTANYEITKPTKLKDLSVNTRMSIGSHGYGINLPVNGDCILWRYCLAPYKPDHLVRARIIDKKPMIRACEDKDPNNEYYKVFYIDYGTTNWVKKRVCYEMPSEEWFTKPPEALPISLYNMMPKSSLFDDPNMKLEWTQNVCLALRQILDGFKYFEIHIKNYLLIRKRSDQTYACDVTCYLQNPKTHPEFAGTGQNLSQLLANKCIDQIILINGVNPDTDIPRYEASCRFDRNTFNLPDYLSHKSMRLHRDQASVVSIDSKLGADSVSLLQHNSLDPHLLVPTSNNPKSQGIEKKCSRVPVIEIDPELWPSKGLPWKIETLKEEGFLNDNHIYISYCCRNITPDCFNFSSHIIKHNRIENIINEKESFSKYQLDILEAKKHLDTVLLSFYSMPENRRIFSWDYVKNKLKENEVVNCIVGMLENSDDDRYRCHRARILGIIEDFANELKGIKNDNEEEGYVKFIIVELYDYGGVMSVSVDSVCQIHPLHENISPFTLRCSLSIDTTRVKNRKFRELIKISPKWYRDIKREGAKSVCSSLPSKAKIIQYPSNNNTYKFDYFINPSTDPLCYKITNVQQTYFTRQHLYES